MVKLEVHNSFVKVIADKAVQDEIYNILKYEVNNAYMQRSFGYGPSTKSFHNRKTKAFYTGLLPLVENGLKERNIDFEVFDMRKDIPATGTGIDIPKIKYYDFQVEAIKAFLNAKRGILQAATGSGKTIMAKGIFKAVNVPTLFLTHRVNLLYQSAERFARKFPDLKKSGQIGVIGDGNYDPQFLTFATTQTLHSFLKKDLKTTLEDLSQFQMIIVDEAHRMKSTQFREVVAACVNANWRLALTATPFMRNDDEEDMALVGSIGDVFYKVTNKQLIDLGLLAQPLVKYYHVTKPNISGVYYEYRDVYENGIVKNDFRNNMIVSALKELLTVKKQILVIIHEIDHGNRLVDLIEKAGLKTDFCSGKMSAYERKAKLKLLEKNKVDCLVATTIFDEGIDIKTIGGVVLGGGGKSLPMLYQRIGRSMRKKDENYCVVIDFFDHTHPFLKKHSNIRYQAMSEDNGFKIIGGRKND